MAKAPNAQKPQVFGIFTERGEKLMEKNDQTPLESGVYLAFGGGQWVRASKAGRLGCQTGARSWSIAACAKHRFTSPVVYICMDSGARVPLGGIWLQTDMYMDSHPLVS